MRKRAGKPDNTVVQIRDDVGLYKETAVEMEREESFRTYLRLWDG